MPTEGEAQTPSSHPQAHLPARPPAHLLPLQGRQGLRRSQGDAQVVRSGLDHRHQQALCVSRLSLLAGGGQQVVLLRGRGKRGPERDPGKTRVQGKTRV